MKNLLLFSFCVLLFHNYIHAQLTHQIIPINKKVHGEVAGGYILTTPSSLDSEAAYPNSLLILDSIGNPVFFKPFTDRLTGPYDRTPISDFKVQPSGLLSFSGNLTSGELGMYFLDSTFTIVDSIQTTNGFATDGHDLVHSADGFYHLVGYENRTIDISHMVTTEGEEGSTEANVLGNVIQRFNAEKNLVFEWKSIDHYLMEDTYQHAFTEADYLDHAHYNSLEIDYDGHYLLSFRNLHEITKVDAQTGDIIWQFGGKNNDFTFLGDTMLFSVQHDARRIANGNLTIFDNGAYNSTPIARGIEYKLDEINKTATVVWQFREPNGIASRFIGNATRLPNGNTMINWGGAFPLEQTTSFTEVDRDGNIVLELDLAHDRYISYRAIKQELPFRVDRPLISCDKGTATLSGPDGHAQYEWSTGQNTQSIAISKTGSYQLWVDQGIGFVSSQPFYVSDLSDVCNTTNPNLTSFMFYPNPVKDRLFVEYPLNDRVSAQILDASGRVVWKGAFEGDVFPKEIDVQQLPAGVYFLQIKDIVEKFVKL